MRAPILVLLVLTLLTPVAAAQAAASPKRTATPKPAAAPDPAAAVLKQADAARQQEHLTEALTLYRKAAQLNPKSLDAWWAIGTITYDQDQFAECAPAFNRVVVLRPGEAPGWTMAGLCAYGVRSYENAYRCLLHADRLGFQGAPELAKVGRFHLALLHSHYSSFERALVVLTLLARSSPITPEFAAAAGIAGLRKTWLLREVPESEQPLVMAFGEALVAAFAQDPKTAVAKFETALASYPGNPDIHYRLGAYLMKQGLDDRARAEMKRALELDPDHIPALVSLSEAARVKGELDAAVAYGLRALKLAPGNFAAHLIVGRAYLSQERTADAIAELEQAVKLAPDSPDAHYSLSSAYAAAGRTKDAARERVEFDRLKN
jgi:tetratricopeptide (TPR) repeat protein